MFLEAMARESARKIVWPYVKKQQERVDRVYEKLGSNFHRKLLEDAKEVKDLTQLKLKGYYHERDWADI